MKTLQDPSIPIISLWGGGNQISSHKRNNNNKKEENAFFFLIKKGGNLKVAFYTEDRRAGSLHKTITPDFLSPSQLIGT